MDLSGVSFLSGFAAGVGIGLFVSCFDAACDKKQQAGVDIDECPGGVAVKNLSSCPKFLPRKSSRR